MSNSRLPVKAKILPSRRRLKFSPNTLHKSPCPSPSVSIRPLRKALRTTHQNLRDTCEDLDESYEISWDNNSPSPSTYAKPSIRDDKGGKNDNNIKVMLSGVSSKTKIKCRDKQPINSTYSTWMQDDLAKCSFRTSNSSVKKAKSKRNGKNNHLLQEELKELKIIAMQLEQSSNIPVLCTTTNKSFNSTTITTNLPSKVFHESKNITKFDTFDSSEKIEITAPKSSEAMFTDANRNDGGDSIILMNKEQAVIKTDVPDRCEVIDCFTNIDFDDDLADVLLGVEWSGVEDTIICQKSISKDEKSSNSSKKESNKVIEKGIERTGNYLLQENMLVDGNFLLDDNFADSLLCLDESMNKKQDKNKIQTPNPDEHTMKVEDNSKRESLLEDLFNDDVDGLFEDIILDINGDVKCKSQETLSSSLLTTDQKKLKSRCNTSPFPISNKSNLLEMDTRVSKRKYEDISKTLDLKCEDMNGKHGMRVQTCTAINVSSVITQNAIGCGVLSNGIKHGGKGNDINDKFLVPIQRYDHNEIKLKKEIALKKLKGKGRVVK